jgi:hypothetical protein
LQSDDPNVRAYANSLRYPDDAKIEVAFTAFGPEDGSSWNPFYNPYQAANMIVDGFLDSLPIDVYREEKIDAVTKDLSEKVKNAYNALVPILNSCTETVATGQTSYCTSQAALVMEIRNILISQGKNPSEVIFSYDNGSFAEEQSIIDIWRGLGGNETNPIPIIVDGFTVIYTPTTSANQNSLVFKKNESSIKIDSDYRGDHFDEDGNFISNNYPIKQINKGYYTGYGLVVVNTSTGQKLVNKMEFSQSNAKILAGIAKHYAQKMNLDIARLFNSKFSVVLKVPNSGTSNCLSLYNGGSCSSQDIMNTNINAHYISITVQGSENTSTSGSVHSSLEYVGNFESVIYHEWQHLLGLGGEADAHLEVYRRQITHESFKNVTPNFIKEIVTPNIKEMVYELINSPTPSIHSAGIAWKNAFILLGIKFD